MYNISVLCVSCFNTLHINTLPIVNNFTVSSSKRYCRGNLKDITILAIFF